MSIGNNPTDTRIVFTLKLWLNLPGSPTQAQLDVSAMLTQTLLTFSGALGPKDSYTQAPVWPNAFGINGFDVYYLALGISINIQTALPAGISFDAKFGFTSKGRDEKKYIIGGGAVIGAGQQRTAHEWHDACELSRYACRCASPCPLCSPCPAVLRPSAWLCLPLVSHPDPNNLLVKVEGQNLNECFFFVAAQSMIGHAFLPDEASDAICMALSWISIDYLKMYVSKGAQIGEKVYPKGGELHASLSLFGKIQLLAVDGQISMDDYTAKMNGTIPAIHLGPLQVTGEVGKDMTVRHTHTPATATATAYTSDHASTRRAYS